MPARKGSRRRMHRGGDAMPGEALAPAAPMVQPAPAATPAATPKEEEKQSLTSQAQGALSSMKGWASGLFGSSSDAPAPAQSAGKRRTMKKGKSRKARSMKKRAHKGTMKRKHYKHPKKGQKSKTMKGKLDFTTKKGHKFYNRKGHRQSRNAQGRKGRPYMFFKL